MCESEVGGSWGKGKEDVRNFSVSLPFQMRKTPSCAGIRHWVLAESLACRKAHYGSSSKKQSVGVLDPVSPVSGYKHRWELANEQLVPRSGIRIVDGGGGGLPADLQQKTQQGRCGLVRK